MRGDKTFAYDLDTPYGAVSGRVALLLRSTEAKPRWLCFVLTYTPIYSLCLQGIEGDYGLWGRLSLEQGAPWQKLQGPKFLSRAHNSPTLELCVEKDLVKVQEAGRAYGGGAGCGGELSPNPNPRWPSS